MARSAKPSSRVRTPDGAATSTLHRQSLWAATLPGARRVELPDWHAPRRSAWVEALDRAVGDAIAATGDAPILVAHSLGCLAVAHWAHRSRGLIAVALLVAPADAERPRRPALADFAPIPRSALGFPSIVVASDDDPYLAVSRARTLASAWRARLVLLRGAGHVNVRSGHGEWPDGLALLGQLLAPRITRRRRSTPAAPPGRS